MFTTLDSLSLSLPFSSRFSRTVINNSISNFQRIFPKKVKKITRSRNPLFLVPPRTTTETSHRPPFSPCGGPTDSN